MRLRRPFCINDLAAEHTLRDRRLFYEVLERNHIPTPTHVVVSRDGPSPTVDVVELEDAIEVGGVRINKPFVEKPVDAEDHNIYIYYPGAWGGGPSASSARWATCPPGSTPRRATSAGRGPSSTRTSS